jgi:outer membrane protein W
MNNKAFIPLLILFIISSNVFSQKFYVKPYAGYSIGTFKNGVVTESKFYMVYADSVSSYAIENLNNFSIAKGWNTGITFGYKFNPNIGIEMGVSYCFGKPTSIEITEKYDFYNDPNHYVKLDGTNTYKSNILCISPSLLITKQFKDFNPYIKIGGILNYVFLSEEYFERVTTNIPGYIPFYNNSSELKYNSSLSFGLLTSVGTEYQIGENFSVFVDIQNSVAYYSPKKAELLNYLINGENIINSLNVNEKEFVFENRSFDTGNINEPSKRIKNTFSLCNLSFNLGLKINLFTVKNK